MAFSAAAGKTATLLYGPAGQGTSERLTFDAAGKAEIALPPLGAAVYAVE